MFSFKKSFFIKISALLVFLFLIFFFQGENAFRFGRAPAFFLLEKPASLFASLGGWVGNEIGFFSSIGNLKKENEKLFQENLSLKGEMATLEEVKGENDQLRKELGLAQRENLKAQASLVVARSLENGQATFFIDKGSESDLAPGMAVLANQKFLIGRIKRVFWRGAEVELVFSANFLAGVEIQDQGAQGIVQGSRGTSAILDKIPQPTEVEKGQSLITSGLGGEFPRGILVGFVGEELENGGELFRRFSVDFPLEMEKIRLVWVVKNN